MIKPYKVFRALKIERLAHALQTTCTKIALDFKKSCYNTRYSKRLANKRGVKILVVANLGGIGNCIAATPLVIALRAIYPSAHITFLTVKGDLFENWCVVDGVIENQENLPDDEFDFVFVSYWGYPNPPQWVKEIKTKKLMLSKVWLNSWFLKPERDYNVDLARKLGFKGQVPPEYVTLKQPQILMPEKIISILPCSNNEPQWQAKRWRHYGELIKELLKTYPDHYIAVIGTETDDIDDIEFSSRVLDYRGKLTLAQTAYVLKNSTFAVGNDCGPAHIADCVGTKVFIIFASSCPVKNAFINKSTQIITTPNCAAYQYRAKEYDEDCHSQETAVKEILDTIRNSQ